MTALQTATFTWQDMAPRAYRDSWAMYDADRDTLPFGSKALRSAVATNRKVAGVLAWNKTRDQEGGHLVMLTGQTREQELNVIENAGWMTSCGAIYAIARCGNTGYKLQPDARFKVDEELFLAWLLFGEADVEGMRR